MATSMTGAVNNDDSMASSETYAMSVNKSIAESDEEEEEEKEKADGRLL